MQFVVSVTVISVSLVLASEGGIGIGPASLCDGFETLIGTCAWLDVTVFGMKPKSTPKSACNRVDAPIAVTQVAELGWTFALSTREFQ
jgi:hypothetical protein